MKPLESITEITTAIVQHKDTTKAWGNSNAANDEAELAVIFCRKKLIILLSKRPSFFRINVIELRAPEFAVKFSVSAKTIGDIDFLLNKMLPKWLYETGDYHDEWLKQITASKEIYH